MNKELVSILEYLEREKGIKRDVILSAIEEALSAAARKSVKGFIGVSVKIDAKSGDIEVFAQKEVVEEGITIPQEEILLEEARELKEDCEVGDWIDIEVFPEDFGRIAAQTARQVIGQKLRSAERDVIQEEYRHRINELVSGTIKRVVRTRTLIIDLGKVEAILPERFYPRMEHYTVGERVLALLYEVKDTDSGGAEVVLSRNHPEFVRQLFLQEVPELEDETVTIEKIARDPGYRTKIAVSSHDPRVDPVGACVGVRGTRVKNVIRELNNEKIDLLPYAQDKVDFLENALAPTEIKKISVSDDESRISIVVDDEAYPIVLGKKGTNARLCGELVGIRFDVKRMSDYQTEMNIRRAQAALLEDPKLDQPIEEMGFKINPFVVESLKLAGYGTARKIFAAAPNVEIPGLSSDMLDALLEEIGQTRL